LQDNYWKQNFAGASKLVGDRLTMPVVPKTQAKQWKQNINNHYRDAGPLLEYHQSSPEKTKHSGHSKNSNNRIKRWPQINVLTTQKQIDGFFVFFFLMAAATLPATIDKTDNHTQKPSVTNTLRSCDRLTTKKFSFFQK
jgi:hypothetical protein